MDVDVALAIESLANSSLLDQWHREKGMLAFSLRSPDAVASIEHLIAMKSGTGRNKDQIDIEELKKLQQEANHDG